MIKDTLILVGLAATFALSMVTFIVFMSAYFSPSDRVVVDVNNYNEAHVEFILLSALLPLTVFSTVATSRRVMQKQDTYILADIAFPEDKYDQRSP